MKRYYYIFLQVVILLLCLYPSNLSLALNLSDSSETNYQQNQELEISIEKLESFMDSARAFETTETRKSILYAYQVLNSAEHQNLSVLKIKALLQLGWSNRSLQQYDSAIAYFNQAAGTSEAVNDTTLLLKSFRGLGSTYRSAGQTRISINYLQRILEYEATFNDKAFIASTLSSLQSRYKDLAEYENALEYGFRSLSLREKIGNKRKIGSSQLKIANVYRHLNDYPNAILYTDMAEENYKAVNYNRLEGIHNQRGLLSLGAGNYEQAIRYFKLAYDSNKSHGDLSGMGRELGNMSIAYRRLGEYEKSLEYQLIALDFKRKANDIRYIGNSYGNIARIYTYLKDYSKAKLYLDTAYQISVDLELNNRIMGIYWDYSELYEEMGDYKNSLNYYKLYTSFKDSIYSSDNQKLIAEMEAMYELNKIESENALLRKDNEIQDLEIEKHKSERLLLLIVLGFGIVFLVIIYTRFLQKRKANRLLEHKNHLITKQKDELKAVNATKDKFFSIIAHDLKNPFNSILGFTEVLDESYDNFSDEERKRIIGILTKTSNHLFKLLQNLLTWARTQKGNIKISKETVLVSSLVNDALVPFLGAISLKKINIRSEVAEDISVFIDFETIRTAIGNIINNAIKFTNINGEIVITSTFNEEEAIISIKDSGVGMSNETLNKLFRIEESFSNPGTADEKGTGLGLIISKEFVSRNGGKIWAESVEGQGSVFRISLPVF